jgi:hypothetical protein
MDRLDRAARVRALVLFGFVFFFQCVFDPPPLPLSLSLSLSLYVCQLQVAELRELGTVLQPLARDLVAVAQVQAAELRESGHLLHPLSLTFLQCADSRLLIYVSWATCCNPLPVILSPLLSCASQVTFSTPLSLTFLQSADSRLLIYVSWATCCNPSPVILSLPPKSSLVTARVRQPAPAPCL